MIKNIASGVIDMISFIIIFTLTVALLKIIF